jgi:hypothetical protein
MLLTKNKGKGISTAIPHMKSLLPLLFAIYAMTATQELEAASRESYKIDGVKARPEITTEGNLRVLRWRLKSTTRFRDKLGLRVELDTRKYLRSINGKSIVKVGEDFFKNDNKSESDPKRKFVETKKWTWICYIYSVLDRNGRSVGIAEVEIETETSNKPHAKAAFETSKRRNQIPYGARGISYDLVLVDKPPAKGIIEYSESVDGSPRKPYNEGRFETDIIVKGVPK